MPGGVDLSRYTGPKDITTPGTVIDGKEIAGPLRIRADNVTIKRSIVTGSSDNSDLSVIRVYEDADNALIEDVEAAGGGGACGIAVELAGTGGTARRVDAHGCADFFRSNEGTTVVDSYGHNRWNGPGVHSDAVQALGDSNLVFRHNTLVLPGGSGVNNVIAIGGEYGRPSSVTIENNLLDGGGYTIGIDPGTTKLKIVNNRFGDSFSYGAVRSNGAAMTFSGNVWDEAGQALSLSEALK